MLNAAFAVDIERGDGTTTVEDSFASKLQHRVRFTTDDGDFSVSMDEFKSRAGVVIMPQILDLSIHKGRESRILAEDLSFSSNGVQIGISPDDVRPEWKKEA